MHDKPERPEKRPSGTEKRVHAREWKRKRRRNKLIGQIVAVLVGLVFVAGICFVAWDIHSRSWIMEFNGRRIAASDYEFSLRHVQLLQAFGELPAQIDPHELALANLTNALLIGDAAARHNIAVSPAALEVHENLASEMADMLPQLNLTMPNISTARMLEIMSSEDLVQELVPLYTEDLEIDENEMEESFAQFLATERRAFTDADLRFIVADSLDVAWNHWDVLLDTSPAAIEVTMRRLIEEEMAFAAEMAAEAGEEFMPPEPLPEDWEPNTATMPELAEWAAMGILAAADVERLTRLQAGDISEPMQIEDGDSYVVFIVDEITVRDEYDVGAEFREGFIMERRFERFSEILGEWREAAVVELNQRAIDAIT